MIPMIGLVIAGYVILRCVEIACKPESAFRSHGAQTVVILLAVVGILLGLLATAEMVVGGGLLRIDAGSAAPLLVQNNYHICSLFPLTR